MVVSLTSHVIIALIFALFVLAILIGNAIYLNTIRTELKSGTSTSNLSLTGAEFFLAVDIILAVLLFIYAIYLLYWMFVGEKEEKIIKRFISPEKGAFSSIWGPTGTEVKNEYDPNTNINKQTISEVSTVIDPVTRQAVPNPDGTTTRKSTPKSVEFSAGPSAYIPSTYIPPTPTIFGPPGQKKSQVVETVTPTFGLPVQSSLPRPNVPPIGQQKVQSPYGPIPAPVLQSALQSALQQDASPTKTTSSTDRSGKTTTTTEYSYNPFL